MSMGKRGKSNGRAVFHAEVTVDTEAGALYIQLADVIEDGEATTNELVSLDGRESEVVFDLNDRKELLGIEIIGIGGLLKGWPGLRRQEDPNTDE